MPNDKHDGTTGLQRHPEDLPINDEHRAHVKKAKERDEKDGKK